MGERTRRRAVITEGAAASAPTAPHATPGGDEQTGPARFWSARRVKQGLVVGFVVSVLFHYAIDPFSVLPAGPSIEIHDQDGDLSIPIDFIGEGPNDDPGSTSHEAPSHGANAGIGPSDASTDAGAGDARALALTKRLDAGRDGSSDAGAGDAEAEGDDGGMIAVADGGVGRDPHSLLGAAGAVSAGPNNVTVMVNFVELRKHPDAPRVAMILGAIPQWRAFMSNAEGTAMIDPVHDADWMIIMGPSLRDTQRDAVFIHYGLSDAKVDRIIDTVAKQSRGGGRIDVGVRGVKAWKAFADKADRAFLRPRSHVVVIVPASHARQFAAVLARSPIRPHVRAGEALSVRALRPGGSISAIPPDISELRLWIVPNATDGSADLYAEGDCPTDAAAQADAEAIHDLIQQKNSLGVRLLTAGFLNNVDVSAGSKTVHLHLHGTQQQIEAILALVAGVVHVTLPPPTPRTSP